MAQNKFGEYMHENEDEYKEMLMGIKRRYIELVQRGAPVFEVDAVREEGARLQSCGAFYEDQGEESQIELWSKTASA